MINARIAEKQVTRFTFTLIVDDVGVKHANLKHAQHLIEVIKQKYETSTDWKGILQAVVSLYCNYKKHKVRLSAPKCVVKC